MTAPDVLIVGAGPVGLTMAAGLAAQGIRCRIIDKAPAPSDKSKALVIWSRTLELLDKLQLATTFVNAGRKVRGASIHGDGKRLVHVEMAGVESPFGFPLMIPQDATERLLTEHLCRQGIEIERSVELTSFEELGDRVVCRLRRADGHEESLEVPWLIGCDGAHSTVRHALGMPFTGSAEPNDWLLADVHIGGDLPPDEICVYWHHTGALVIFPITPTRFRVVADLGMATSAARRPDPTLAEVQAKVDERGPGGLILSDPIWLASFRINERKVSDYRRGRVLLAGDAAHIHSPAGGQGMNTGMQDAFNLAWKLALVVRSQGQADVLLDSYSSERSAVGDQVLHAAEVMTHVATLRNPLAQFVRNHVASVVSSFGFVQDKFKNALCELSIQYRSSPLSVDAWEGREGSIQAGDRLPDGGLRCVQTGRETTLYAELRGGEHALLLFAPEPDAEQIASLQQVTESAKRRVGTPMAVHLILPGGSAAMGGMRPEGEANQRPIWLDATGALFHKLGVQQNALVVVRPDGYVGLRQQPADGAGLTRYLEKYLVAVSNRASG
jgi:2-polyprenyl-6-methoxyphenol hydroxylase-like FAD-dependent oxidoreductase